MTGVEEGLGGTSFTYDDNRAVLSAYLQKNIYAFSAAKSLVQLQHYRDLMIDKDGKLLEYGSFRKLVANQGETFNNSYLKAEYDAAKYSAIMAHKWDTLPEDYLEYSTVGDSKVRPAHALLDKFTALKSDPVWNKIYPIKDWGCRCTVVPGKEQNVGKRMTSAEAGRMMKPLIEDTIFDNHVGKSRVIFNDNHPYFQNANGKVSSLSWKQYGLPNIEKIRTWDLPEYTSMSKDQYFQWWKDLKKIGDDVIVEDSLGQQIRLGEKYKEHVLRKASEKRYEYAGQTIDVLKNPDEVWYNEQGRVYLKYYEQGTLKIAVNDKLEAVTMFKLYDQDSGELKNARRGVLLRKK